MLAWLKSFFFPPRPLGAPRLLRAFGASDRPLRKECVPVKPGGWQIECRGRDSIPLFMIENPAAAGSLVTYRAEVQAQGGDESVRLELVGLYDDGREAISRSLAKAFAHDGRWHALEVTHAFRTGRSPDLLHLNVLTEGVGRIRIDKIKVLATPTN